MTTDIRSRYTSNDLRKPAVLVGFAILFSCVGWSIYWYVAHRLALAELQSTLARELREGRDWKCESIGSGGFPFSIDIDCDRPTITAATEAGPIVAHAAKAVVKAPLYTPKRVAIDLQSPGDVSLAQSAVRFDLTWDRLQFSTRGLPERLERFSISGAGIDIRTNLDEAPTRVDAFQTNLRHAGGADPALNFEISVAGIVSPTLDAILGGGEAAVLATTGSITQYEKATGRSFVDMMEQWRSAGGRAAIAQLSLVKGRFAAQCEGSLGLDQGHKIDGKLDLNIANAGAALTNLASRLGAGGIAMGAIASGLFGADRQNGVTHISVQFENGRLGIGPLRGILALPPLY